ncbi:MAG: chorismate mutase [Oscillospiraceae bacterium]|jgi:chorismate mutase/prephenate dehydratase|nr:chorismate mutase [Oscillospiraceae bacterium]
MQNELKLLREQIDKTDNEIVKLFWQRMELSKQVGLYKKKNGLPVLNANRENEILDDIEQKCGSYGSYARTLYADIMALSRALQYNLTAKETPLRGILSNAQTQNALADVKKTALQGLKGANSHAAALKMFPQSEYVFFSSFADVFDAVKNDDKIEIGIMPVENSTAGAVVDVYDLILKHRFYIVGAANIKIEHCLCGVAGATLEGINKVLSHPQALAQCKSFINANGLNPEPCSNTAVAAKTVAENNDKAVAAICSAAAANEYGLAILKTGIQSYDSNTTRFIAISKKLIIPQDAKTISLCFRLPHTTGALYNILGRFAAAGLNLTKIESRPIPGEDFEYLFYLDFAGNVKKGETIDLICALQTELPEFSFLGNYALEG